MIEIRNTSLSAEMNLKQQSFTYHALGRFSKIKILKEQKKLTQSKYIDQNELDKTLSMI